jgi:hypothetical protein
MIRDPLQIIINAAENANAGTPNLRAIYDVLVDGKGPGNLVRAIFSDCPREALIRAAASIEVNIRQLDYGYAVAKKRHLAHNHEFETLIDE